MLTLPPVLSAFVSLRQRRHQHPILQFRLQMLISTSTGKLNCLLNGPTFLSLTRSVGAIGSVPKGGTQFPSLSLVPVFVNSVVSILGSVLLAWRGSVLNKGSLGGGVEDEAAGGGPFELDGLFVADAGELDLDDVGVCRVPYVDVGLGDVGLEAGFATTSYIH